MFDGLANLADRSLIHRVDDRGGEPRFRMFETIHEFAAERLRESGELDLMRARHANDFLPLAEAAWESFGLVVQQRQWLARLDSDHDNLRATLSWLQEKNPVGALSLAGALCCYWYIRGHRIEGASWLTRSLNRVHPNEVEPAIRARALLATGVLLQFPDESAEAMTYLQESLVIWERLNDAWGSGFVQLVLGVIDEDSGRYAEGEARFNQAIPLIKSTTVETSLAAANYHLAVVAFGMGDLNRASSIASQIIFVPRGRWSSAACYSLHLLGLIALQQGYLGASALRIRETVEFAREFGIPASIGEGLSAAGSLASATGDDRVAAELFGAVGALARSLGYAVSLPERDVYHHAQSRSIETVGDAEFNAAFEMGKSLPTERAVDTAISCLLRLGERSLTSETKTRAAQAALTGTMREPRGRHPSTHQPRA